MPRDLYQTQCIQNTRLDDVYYTDVTTTEQATVRLRRAYVVAAVLIGVSLMTGVVPAVYVAATAGSTADGGDANWTVCWPCRSSPNEMHCEKLAKVDLTSSTATVVSSHR